MKPSPLLLFATTATNLVLVGVLAYRPSIAPPAFRDFFARSLHTTEFRGFLARHFHFAESNHPSPTPRPAAAGAFPTEPKPKLWTAFETDDLHVLVARLRAAGFPTLAIAEIVKTRVNALYDARLRSLTDSDPNTPYWQLGSTALGMNNPRRLEEFQQLQRDRAKALREVLTDDLFPDEGLDVGQRRMWGDLPREKLDRIQKVEDDYTEMLSAARMAMNGITLAEDKEKFALLEREHLADIAAILTPEELAEYNVRAPSAIKSNLISRLANMDATETEFRAILQAQQNLNDRYAASHVPPGDNPQRRAIQQEMEAQIQSALGEARYAEYTRTMNSEFQQLNRIAEREKLPPATTIQAFSLRDQTAQESNRIFDDPALNAEQKRAALQSLAQNTRTQLLATLGNTAGAAYVRVAGNWLGNIERGAAVSFVTSEQSSGNPLNSVTTAPGVVAVKGVLPTYRRLPNSTPAGPGPGGLAPVLRAQ